MYVISFVYLLHLARDVEVLRYVRFHIVLLLFLLLESRPARVDALLRMILSRNLLRVISLLCETNIIRDTCGLKTVSNVSHSEVSCVFTRHSRPGRYC